MEGPCEWSSFPRDPPPNNYPFVADSEPVVDDTSDMTRGPV